MSSDKQTTAVDLNRLGENWSSVFEKEQEAKTEQHRKNKSYPAGYVYKQWTKTIPDFDNYDTQTGFWCHLPHPWLLLTISNCVSLIALILF